jgi:hypothetical protein
VALSFPNSPTVGQIYTDSTSGFSYEWDGTVWKSFAAASSANIKIIDDISSSFNGSTQTFSLTSNGSAITPPTAQSLIVNLGGVIQDPSDDYSVSGSQITFSTAPTTGLTFSATSLGPAVPVSTIPADTTTQGAFNVAGILSATSMKVAGVTTATADGVNITGILTATTVIVGSAVTINSTGLNATGVVTSTGVNVAGIVTASGGVQGIGIYSGGNLVRTGVITALNFVGTGNTFLVSGNRVDISIAGGGGGGTSYNELDGMLFG